jgi:glycerol kinase
LETTALGAAYLAGLGVGYWESMETLPEQAATEMKNPLAERDDEMVKAYSGWQRAVKAARMFPFN